MHVEGSGVAIRLRVTLALLAVTTTALGATSSHGAHTAGGCGGTWSGARSCLFYARGLPVSARGDSQVSSGTASVDVRVSPYVEGADLTDVSIAGCTDSGGAFATCQGELGAGRTLDSTRQLTLLVCSVRGRGSGQYFCYSGLGL